MPAKELECPCMRGREGRYDSTLLGLGVFLLYLAWPSRLHLFDGVACAVAVELGDLRHLVHGNHLIYGVVGLVFHRFLGGLGVPLNALFSLQLMDSLLGAAGAGIFFSLLRRIGYDRKTAAFCSLGMSFSYAYWLWSLEANVYLLGLVCLLLALRASLSDRPRPYHIAFWHGLAMLGHGANALFVLVPIASLWARSPSPREDTAKYLTTAAAFVLAAYTLSAMLWIRPDSSEGLKLWLLGSAALGEGRSLRWQGGFEGWNNLLDWIRTSGRVVSTMGALGAPVWLAALASPFLAGREQARATLSGWLWLPAYLALFLFWQPYNLIYRVTDAAPLWLLAAPAVSLALSGAFTRVLAALFLAAVFAVNLGSVVMPNSRAENNPSLQKALWISSATPEDAWVCAEENDEVYLPYFGRRHPLNLRYFKGREAALLERVRAIQKDGAPVYLTSSALRDWRQVFETIGLEEGPRRADEVLYRVKEF